MADIKQSRPEDCHYSFFSNAKCEFFPCHSVVHPKDFNCLFCYCPLYALGAECGGNFSYTTEGIKDCSACLLPHGRDSYTRITARFSDIQALAARNNQS